MLNLLVCCATTLLPMEEYSHDLLGNLVPTPMAHPAILPSSYS